MSTLVLGLYSTVLSEAAAMGVLPVVLRLGDRHRIFPAPEDEGAGVLVSTPGEATEQIARLLEDRDLRAAYSAGLECFSMRNFGRRDGRALERIVSQIESPRA